jgi:restriction system protein
LTYASRIGFALTALKMAGLAEAVSVGVWQLTKSGRTLAAKHPTGMTEDLAREIDKQNRKDLASREDGSPNDADLDESLTQPDRISRVHDAIAANNRAVVDQLLEEMRRLQPEQFELLALRVLRQAGYGHESTEPRHTGKSGDGGIDGWLPLDRLGLQKVYVQAKRYKESSAITASNVRDFVGAMSAKGARMGVFVTLSRFTDDARTAARNPERTIELMDGEDLAKLMIELKMGVSHTDLPPLAVFDRDFFEGI